MKAKPSYKELEQRVRELEKHHRQLEKNLNEERIFSETLLRSSPALYAALGPDGRVLAMSETMLQTLGYTLDEVVGTDYLPTFVPEHERSMLSGLFDSIVDTGRVTLNENHVIAKDGRVILVEWHGRPVFKTNGKLDFFFGVGMDITGRKKIEHALRDSERRLRDLIDFLPDPTMAIDLEGRMIVWNKASERLTGISAEDMLGEVYHKYMSPLFGVQRPLLMDYLLHPELADEHTYHEFKYIDGSLIAESHSCFRGKWIWMLIKASKLFDGQGNVIGAIQSLHEITDEKEAQQRLKISEESYRTIFENTGTATFIIEDDTTISLVNSRTEQLTGYSKTEIEGRMSWKEIVPEEDRDRIMNYHVLRRLDNPDAPRSYESVIKDRNGNVRNAIFTVSMIPGTRQSIASLVDITDRKRTEDALKSSEERYRLLAENIHDVIWIMSIPDLRLQYISPSVERIYGYSVEEIKELLPQDYLQHDSLARGLDILTKELTREKEVPVVGPRRPMTDEQEVIRKDGTSVWTEISATFMLDEHGKPSSLLGVTRDITERKIAEEARKIYEARLSRSQKMEALGTLAGGIAHDFNNILSPIIGFTELTLEDLPKGSPPHNNLTEILTAANRAKDLVRQILAFSRQVETVRKPVRVHLMVKEAVKLLRSTIPSTIEIRQQINPRSGSVLAEPTQIHQVLMNLCTNAYQAMIGDGGVLSIRLEPVSIGRQSTCLLPNIQEGDYIRLTVKDTGCGMDDHTIQRIFDPFYTTKKTGIVGTGLGMATVHNIVSSLGGAVTVTSEPGKGSSFEVYLPMYIGEDFEEESQQNDLPRGNGECILMVDDEKTILEMGRSMLENLGYRAVVMSSSVQALNAFRKNPGGFDCLLTDKTMPRMTGEQLAAEMLKLRPDLPVIISSGFFEYIAPKERSLPGSPLLLEKPYTMLTLARAVKSSIEST